MARIVVVGAGLGGMSAAYEARDLLGKAHEVVLLGKGPTCGFTPSNPWLAVGWRNQSEITLSVDEHVGKHRIRFIPDGVETIDAEGDAVVTGAGECIGYGYLLIATGVSTVLTLVVIPLLYFVLRSRQRAQTRDVEESGIAA